MFLAADDKSALLTTKNKSRSSIGGRYHKKNNPPPPPIIKEVDVTMIILSSALRTAATLLCFLASTNSAAAFTNIHTTVKRSSNKTSYQSSKLNLYNSVEEAISEAQRICNEQGGDSEACKVAWDIVEELEAADAHRTPAHPTSQQELSYGPLIMSLDLLSAKIDRKMDELNKLSTSLVEAGAGPEVERLAYASEEMKGILEEAVRSLDVYR